MLILRYIRWTGTQDEFRDYAEKMKEVCDEIDGVSIKGVYEPYSAWHFVFLIETTSNEKFLEALHANTKKNGRTPHISLIKAELLFPLDQLRSATTGE